MKNALIFVVVVVVLCALAYGIGYLFRIDCDPTHPPQHYNCRMP